VADVPTELLGNDALLASGVVANYAMNRQRQLAGVNSDAREVGREGLRDRMQALVVVFPARFTRPPRP
jgi:hypothetical protein